MRLLLKASEEKDHFYDGLQPKGAFIAISG